MPKYQAKDSNDLVAAQNKYENVANSRLNNIAHGEWSPWLALQQAYLNNANLMPAERAANPSGAGGYFTPESNARDQRWEDAVKEAEGIANGNKGHLNRFVP